MTTPRTPLRPLSERLDREWRQLNRRPAVLTRVTGWALTDPGDPPLASLDDLLVRAGHRVPGTAASDAVLRRLLDLAATEPLAARIVLQRILPGLLAIVRREQRRCPDVDAFDLLVGEAWLAIVRYRTDTRPTDIAARLLHDARHRAFTNPRRRRRVPETLCPPHRLVEPPPPDPSPFEELAAVVSEARQHGLADRDLDVLRGILHHGSSARFARVLRLDARSVRYRRERAVAQVRRALGRGQNEGGRLARKAAMPSCASGATAA